VSRPTPDGSVGDASRAAVDAFDDGIFAVDRDLRLTYLTPPAASMLGIDTDDPVGQPLRDVAAVPSLCATLESVIERGERRTFETSPSTAASPLVVRAAPTASGLTVSMVPRPTEDDPADAWSETRLDRLLAIAPVPTIVVDQEGAVTHANDTAVEELGLPDDPARTDLSVRAVYDVDDDPVPPDGRPYRRVFRTGDPVRAWEGRIAFDDGTDERVAVSAAPLETADGAVEHAVVALGVIPAEPADLEELRMEHDTLEAELSSLFDRITDGMVSVDTDWRFQVVNDRAGALIDVDPDEVLGESLWDVFPEAKGTTFEERYRTAMETQEPVSFVESFEPLDSTFEVSAYPSESGLSIYFRDVTAELERRSELERYREIVEALDDGVYAIDDEGRFVMVNEAYAEMGGHEPDELVGEPVTRVLAAEASRLREQLAEGEIDQATFEAPLQTPQGEVQAEATFSLVPDDDRVHSIGIVRDVSERERREDRLEEQRDRLLEQRENLERLVDINALAQEISQAALEARSRDAIERAVVDALAGSAHYDVAWIGQVGTSPEETDRLAGAGLADDDLDDLIDAVLANATGLVQPEIANRRGSVQVSQNVASDEADPRKDAFDAFGLNSSISLPLEHEGASYGVLTIDTDRSDAFTGTERVVLTRMAETIAFALGSVEYRQRFRLMVQEVTDYAIFMLDEDGYVRTWNEGAERIKGYTADEIVGEHFSTFYTAADREAGVPEANLAAAEAEGRSEDTGWRVTHHGERFWADVVITAIRDEAGEVVGFAKVTQDLTEQRENQRRRERLLRVNTVIRQINQALVRAETHEEVEESLCELLAGTDPYVFAWYGEVHGDDIDVKAWAGEGADYLEELEFDLEADEPQGPTARSLETNSVAVAQDIATEADFEPWREAALDRGFRASMAIPISYGRANYGTIGVYADEPECLSPEEQAVFEELGTSIGHAKNALVRKEGLVAETVTQLALTFELDEPLDLDTDGDGTRFEFEDTVTTAEGDLLHFASVEDYTEADIASFVERSPTVNGYRRLDDDGTRYVFEESETELVTIVTDYGGRISEFSFDATAAEMVVELPVGVEVGEFLAALRDADPTVDLAAQRTVEREGPTGPDLRNEVLESLTDKQHTAIETAYFAGYFEWPRLSDGESVADSLGVSPSTFHQHLRSGERKILERLLED
jgi:PAS domain S-box-containing protein